MEIWKCSDVGVGHDPGVDLVEHFFIVLKILDPVAVADLKGLFEIDVGHGHEFGLLQV